MSFFYRDIDHSSAVTHNLAQITSGLRMVLGAALLMKSLSEIKPFARERSSD